MLFESFGIYETMNIGGENVNGIIYLATNKVNGRKYVGQTTQKFEMRRDQHLKNNKKDSVIDLSIKKYGSENFEWKILNRNIKTKKQLNFLESFWIDYFESRTSQWGYNIREGGSKGAQSEESKRKISESLKGKNNPNYGKPGTMLGKKHSEKNVGGEV